MKVFKMPRHQIQSWLKEPMDGYKVKVVPIKDIPMRADDSLQSYHQDKWPAKATDYRIDDEKARQWGPYEYIRGVKDKRGNIRIADGNHRLRAIANSGYDAVEMPFLDEYEAVQDMFGRKL